MPPANRHNPTRAKSSESSWSLMEFMQAFPDDEACLQWLWRSKCSPDGEHAYFDGVAFAGRVLARWGALLLRPLRNRADIQAIQDQPANAGVDVHAVHQEALPD